METNDQVSVYEVGYHLVPTVVEDALSSEAEKIKAIVTDAGGEIISEGLPELKTIAYPISKTVKAIKNTYSRAYFGWVKFSISPDAIEKIKTALDASDTVLRHLIVGTVKESTLMADKEKRPTTRPEPAKERSKEEPMNTAELDKTIDDLVIN